MSHFRRSLDSARAAFDALPVLEPALLRTADAVLAALKAAGYEAEVIA